MIKQNIKIGVHLIDWTDIITITIIIRKKLHHYLILFNSVYWKHSYFQTSDTVQYPEHLPNMF